jgi:hypothetical protein
LPPLEPIDRRGQPIGNCCFGPILRIVRRLNEAFDARLRPLPILVQDRWIVDTLIMNDS